MKTHLLTGDLKGLYACSCGYDCRILFDWIHGKAGQPDTISLLDVGTHDQVY